MQEKVIETLFDLCGYKSGGKLLVGVSGGPDSFALLHILYSNRIPTVVAHLDHRLREQSRDESNYVESIADQYDLPFISASIDTKKYAQEQRLSIEEAAREVRYNFLFDRANGNDCSAVVVGHTADDQVETVLMHFLRGAGLDGLSGMDYRSATQWDPKLPLLRPMLTIWREEVLEYCAIHHLVPLFDHSNLDKTLYRNKIRHDLIPYLKRYNPNVKEVLWRTANTLLEDRKVLEKEVKDASQSVTIEVTKNFHSFDLKDFCGLATGIQRRILKTCLSSLRPQIRNIGYQIIEKCIHYIENPSKGNRVDLIGGLNLWVGSEWFIIFDSDLEIFPHAGPQLEIDHKSELPIPGFIELKGEWVITAKLLDQTSPLLREIENNQDAFSAFLNIQPLPESLTVRTRIEGERFSPLGLGGQSMKLSDYMINAKIPELVRGGWPLVTWRNDVIWIPGYHISDKVRVSADSKKVVNLVLSRENFKTNI